MTHGTFQVSRSRVPSIDSHPRTTIFPSSPGHIMATIHPAELRPPAGRSSGRHNAAHQEHRRRAGEAHVACTRQGRLHPGHPDRPAAAPV